MVTCGPTALTTEESADDVVSAELPLFVDGHEVTALVDTGADFSIISQRLAARLRKVKTPWTGPPLRSAGGHLMEPVGKCTARIRIDASDFVTSFIILPQCCKDLILGMDFLGEHKAVIDLRERSVTFSTCCVPSELKEDLCSALRVIDDGVTLPPRSCALVSVKCDSSCYGDGIA